MFQLAALKPVEAGPRMLLTLEGFARDALVGVSTPNVGGVRSVGLQGADSDAKIGGGGRDAASTERGSLESVGPSVACAGRNDKGFDLAFADFARDDARLAPGVAKCSAEKVI